MLGGNKIAHAALHWGLGMLLLSMGPLAFGQPGSANVIAALQREFSPTTLSGELQRMELQWFANAAMPFQGMKVFVVSETLGKHRYESDVIAKAVFELTGIQVVHEVTGEDDLAKKCERFHRKELHHRPRR